MGIRRQLWMNSTIFQHYTSGCCPSLSSMCSAFPAFRLAHAYSRSPGVWPSCSCCPRLVRSSKVSLFCDHLNVSHSSWGPAVADLKGRPYGPKCSHFHAVFLKIRQNCMLAPPPWRVSAPSYREFWIRPRPVHSNRKRIRSKNKLENKRQTSKKNFAFAWCDTDWLSLYIVMNPIATCLLITSVSVCVKVWVIWRITIPQLYWVWWTLIQQFSEYCWSLIYHML